MQLWKRLQSGKTFLLSTVGTPHTFLCAVREGLIYKHANVLDNHCAQFQEQLLLLVIHRHVFDYFKKNCGSPSPSDLFYLPPTPAHQPHVGLGELHAFAKRHWLQPWFHKWKDWPRTWTTCV